MTEMILCLACNHENAPDSTECARCSAPLQAGKTKEIATELREEIFRRYLDQHEALQSGNIALYLAGKGQALTVPVEDRVMLGRRGTEGPQPAVDLTDYHGSLLGVSRQHAVIERNADGYSISDLDSTNGTWLNENKLAPQSPRPLRSGDALRLGDLILFVFFPDEHSP
jgi:pSer/pThr/pTyr-binding forkhead associated (FHA) protein